MAYNVLLATQILGNAIRTLAEGTVRGIEANADQCAYWVERSAALATALAPQIGYARAAEISKESVKQNVLIREMARREQLLPAESLDEVLDLRRMTEIGVPGGTHGAGSVG
jgi:aspartate ammonia-lyase